MQRAEQRARTRLVSEPLTLRCDPCELSGGEPAIVGELEARRFGLCTRERSPCGSPVSGSPQLSPREQGAARTRHGKARREARELAKGECSGRCSVVHTRKRLGYTGVAFERVHVH